MYLSQVQFTGVGNNQTFFFFFLFCLAGHNYFKHGFFLHLELLHNCKFLLFNTARSFYEGEVNNSWSNPPSITYISLVSKVKMFTSPS